MNDETKPAPWANLRITSIDRLPEKLEEQARDLWHANGRGDREKKRADDAEAALAVTIGAFGREMRAAMQKVIDDSFTVELAVHHYMAGRVEAVEHARLRGYLDAAQSLAADIPRNLWRPEWVKAWATPDPEAKHEMPAAPPPPTSRGRTRRG